MEKLLQKWLETDETPEDYYALLGLRRFHPQDEEVHKAIRVANRVLLRYQNHQTADKTERTLRLQMQLAQADQTFSDPSRRKQYDETLLNDLMKQYVASVGSDVSSRRREDLVRWLELIHHVHPSRLEEIADGIFSSVRGSQSPPREIGLADPDRTSEPQKTGGEQSLARAARVEAPGAAAPAGSHSRSPDQQPAPAADGPVPVPPPPPIPVVRASTQEQKARGPSIRPPSPITAAARGTSGNVTPSPVSETRLGDDAMQPLRGAPSDRSPSAYVQAGSTANDDADASDYSFLWIVGSAIGSAVVLGLLILLFTPSGTISPVEQHAPPPLDNESLASRQAPRPANDADRETHPPDSLPAAGDSSPDESHGEGDREASKQSSQPPSTPEAEPQSDAEAPPDTPDETPAGEQTKEDTVTDEGAGDKPPPADDLAQEEVDAVGEVKLDFEHPVLALAWNSDGTKLAMGHEAGNIGLYDRPGGIQLPDLPGHQGAVYSLAWNDDGLLASGGDDASVKIWNVAEGALNATLDHPEAQSIHALAWFYRNARLAAADNSRTLRIWNVSKGRPSKGKLLKTLDDGRHGGLVRSLVSVRRSRQEFLYTGHLDGSILAWKVGGSRSLTRMILPLDGDVWNDLRIKQPRLKGVALTPHEREDCLSLSVHPDGEIVAVATMGDIDIWDVSDPNASVRIHTIPGQQGLDGARHLAWHPEGIWLAAGTGTGDVNVFDVGRWKMYYSLHMDGAVMSIAWSPADGKYLAASYDTGAVQIISLAQNGPRLAVEAPFEIEGVLARAQEAQEDGQWAELSRALDVVQMYHVPETPETHRLTIEKLSDQLRKGASEELKNLLSELEGLESEDPSEGMRADAVLDLQRMLDLGLSKPDADSARARLLKISEKPLLLLSPPPETKADAKDG